MSDALTVGAVIWDIDGTLVDSEPNHHRALLDVCARYGVSVTDIDANRFVGVHMRDVWDALRTRFPARVDYETWHAAINKEYAETVSTVVARRYAVEAVRHLHRTHVRQAAVSNSARVVVDANLRMLDLDDCFALSLSLDDVNEGKPDPELYISACIRLGVEPGDVLAVEDSPSGVRSARAAGIRCLAYRTPGFPALAASNEGDTIDDLRAVVRIAMPAGMSTG